VDGSAFGRGAGQRNPEAGVLGEAIEERYQVSVFEAAVSNACFPVPVVILKKSGVHRFCGRACMLNVSSFVRTTQLARRQPKQQDELQVIHPPS
jgi:hypothetical protein